MKDTSLKRAVQGLLRSWDFTVVALEEGEGKSADLFVEDGRDAYTVEVKEKLTERLPEQWHSTDSDSGFYLLTDTAGRRNTLSRVVKKAASQLHSSSSPDVFPVLWFVSVGPDWNLHHQQLHATLYGVRNVVYRHRGSNSAKPCLYATYGEFYRWREHLAGTVMQRLDGGMIFLNDLYPGYESFRQSRLVQCFEQGVWDPVESEASGESLRINADVDRCNEEPVKQYLSKKYGIEVVSLFDLTRFTAESVIPSGWIEPGGAG